nr:pseudouridine synthase [Rubricella aquisinus]
MPDYHPPTDTIEVLHRDESLLVVVKPAGLLSVPGKDPAHADCLLSRLVADDPRVLLVHRLDMDTSGVMVFARTAAAQRHLGLQFERRHLRKTYIARVAGHVAGDQGRIDLPLIADWPNRPLQKVCFETGKPARTDWKVVERGADTTLLRLFPLTGRSHQLRVHCREMGHPILGDRFYGGPPAPRLMLHAARLTLRHPEGGAEVSFSLDVPL